MNGAERCQSVTESVRGWDIDARRGGAASTIQAPLAASSIDEGLQHARALPRKCAAIGAHRWLRGARCEALAVQHVLGSNSDANNSTEQAAQAAGVGGEPE